jgi:hypothetical protein
LELLVGEVSGLARLIETGFEAFVFALGDVILSNVERGLGHVDLILNTLDFVLLHLLGDGGAEVLGAVLGLVSHLLNLNFGGLVVKLLLSEHGVDLLEEGQGSVGCAVNDRLEVFDSDFEFLSLEELAEVNPVVLLLLQFEAVIKLVHLDVVWVVPLQDLSEDPAVGKITLGVCDLVGEVK